MTHWRFDHLSGSHLQSRVKSVSQIMVFMPFGRGLDSSVQTSVTNNRLSKDYPHPDDHTRQAFDTQTIYHHVTHIVWKYLTFHFVCLCIGFYCVYIEWNHETFTTVICIHIQLRSVWKKDSEISSLKQTKHNTNGNLPGQGKCTTKPQFIISYCRKVPRVMVCLANMEFPLHKRTLAGLLQRICIQFYVSVPFSQVNLARVEQFLLPHFPAW